MKLASQILIGIHTAMMIITTLVLILGLVLVIFTGASFTDDIDEASNLPSIVFIIVFGVYIFFGFISSILGIAAIVKLGKAKCKKDVPVALGICILIFNSFIGGILMLCTKDSDFVKTPVTAAAAPAAASDAERIRQFKELADAGTITQEEFEAKKKQILGI